MLYEPIRLSIFDGGIADSQYKGIPNSYFEMVGLDFRSEPGILQLQYKMTASASTIKCLIKNFMSSTSTEVYAVGGTGSDSPQLYKTTDSGVTWTQKNPTNPFSTGDGQGSFMWNDYIFIAGDTKLDVYNPTTGSDTIGWKTITEDGEYHPMIAGEMDGALYIGCGRYVALLTEVSGQTFNPNDTATYTWNATALDLPPSFRIRSMESLGDYLMLGCWKRVGANNYPVAVIYPWNYVLRPQSHEGPISLRRMNGVSAMLNINNRLYAWVGTRGEIFYYNGTTLTKIKKMPTNPGNEVYPEAVKRNFKDYPFFGIRNNSGTSSPGGVYSYGSFDSKYPMSLSLDYPLSPGQTTDYEVGAIHTIGTTDTVLLASWSTASGYGIDYLDTTKRLASGGYFSTLLHRVGTARNKAQIDGFSIYLDRNLSASQSINISYRRKIGDAWTTVKVGTNAKTMDYAEVGGRSEIFVPFRINNVVNIQFKVQFTTAADTSSPYLREVFIQ